MRDWIAQELSARKPEHVVVDLFAGTCSWVWPYEADSRFYDINVELNSAYLDGKHNMVCRNILDWDYQDELGGVAVDIVYASPPCNLYFTNLKQKEGFSTYTEKDKEISLKLIDRTIEIISFLKPAFWVIENPVGKMRKHYPEILGYEPLLVDYCMYGMPYKKPTYLWTNINLQPKRCIHQSHSIGIQVSAKDRARITTVDRVNAFALKRQGEEFNAMIAPALTKEIYSLVVGQFYLGQNNIRDPKIHKSVDFEKEEEIATSEDLHQQDLAGNDKIPVNNKCQIKRQLGIKGKQQGLLKEPH
jgi:hypothetical protein